MSLSMVNELQMSLLDKILLVRIIQHPRRMSRVRVDPNSTTLS